MGRRGLGARGAIGTPRKYAEYSHDRAKPWHGRRMQAQPQGKPNPGDRVGAWHLDEALGRGAFGSAWRARHDDGRVGALKLLPEAPGDELRALAAVRHPWVVSVLDGGGAPAPYLVMELAAGEPLGAWRARAQPSIDEVLPIVAGLADALAAVHHAGITHGDIKPANIVVRDAQQAWLVDFGMSGRRGGTPLYAAPERRDGRPSAPADIYALGLVAWELVVGAPPWEDGRWSDRSVPPDVEVDGPAWLTELLRRTLAEHPGARPTAAELADSLSAHGVTLPHLGPELIRRRARTLYVSRGPVDEAVSRWLAQGGALGLHGPPGSGRSHALDRVANELRARGVAWVRFTPGPHPWEAARLALADPRLGDPVPLPLVESDPKVRATAAAVALEGRAPTLVVLADDVDELDEGSRTMLRVLVQRGTVSVLASSSDPMPDLMEHWGILPPLGDEGVEALVRGCLGVSGELTSLLPKLQDHGQGVPGRIVDGLVAAVAQRVLVQRAHTFHVDDVQLATFRPPRDGDLAVELSDGARALGAWIGLAAGPIPQGDLVGLAEGPPVDAETDLQSLVEEGLALLDAAGYRPANPSSRRLLSSWAQAPERVHCGLATWWRGRHPEPSGPLGWHLALAGDAQRDDGLCAACVDAASRTDPADAARLGDQLIRSGASPRLVAAQMGALAAAGRVDEALALADSVDARGPEHVPILNLAAVLRSGDDDGAALELLDRATALLGDVPPPLSVLHRTAQVHLRAGRYEDVVGVVEGALGQETPTDADEIGHWIGLHVALAQARQHTEGAQAALEVLELVGDVGEGLPARSMLEQSRGLILVGAGQLQAAARSMTLAAEQEGLSLRVRAPLANNAAVIQYFLGNLRQALSLWERAALLFERLGAAGDQSSVFSNLTAAYGELGRWERARQAGRKAVMLAMAVDAPGKEAVAHGNLGDVHFARGEHALASEAWEEAERLARDAGAERELAELSRRRAELALATGERNATVLARKARKRAMDVGHTVEACRAEALLALALAREGNTSDLQARAERATRPLQEASEIRALAEVRLSLAEAWLEAGQSPRMRELLDRVVTYADEVGSAPLRRRADAITVRSGTPGGGDAPLLTRFLDLVASVARERHLPTLLDAVASAALDLLDAERSFVLVSEGGEVRVMATRRRGDALEGDPSMTMVRRAMSGQREVIAGDLDERGDLRGAASVTALDLRSVLCVPMIDRSEVLGVIYVDSRRATTREWEQAGRLMRALAAHAAIAMVNARHLEAARSRAAQAAEVAHDMAGPATVVLSMANEIREEELDREALGKDLDGVGNLLMAMRERFLTDAEHTFVPVDLTALAGAVVGQLSRVAREAGRVLALDLRADAWVLGDRHELDRAVTNLIRNALRFCPRGGMVTLRVDCTDHASLVEVLDEGAGVPEHLLESIFDRGVQAEQDGGHGLGLAIVQRVAVEHAGTVSAQNRTDRSGAIFRLALPRVSAP